MDDRDDRRRVIMRDTDTLRSSMIHNISVGYRLSYIIYIISAIAPQPLPAHLPQVPRASLQIRPFRLSARQRHVPNVIHMHRPSLPPSRPVSLPCCPTAACSALVRFPLPSTPPNLRVRIQVPQVEPPLPSTHPNTAGAVDAIDVVHIVIRLVKAVQ